MSENPSHGSRGGDGHRDEEYGDEGQRNEERGVREHRDEGQGDEERDDGRAESAVGCLLAIAGVAVVGTFALTRAAYTIDGGFEAHARDWGVILVELPLVLFAGLVVPPLTWVVAGRRLRPWAAALVCVAVVGLGLWGLAACWHPPQGPDPGYGPGI
ncbi:hypothetical protein ACFVZH_01360 [Streptomyces sp. NPDC059534]|uniref:hypothetical protein n=1 Tax=Streptomyces sp. NPDC059534 TaxID=3346859 RepID=UPI0036B89068